MADSTKKSNGIGSEWAIKKALADALHSAADDLEKKEMVDGKRSYNTSIEWPALYTFKPEEGPAALRAVAAELLEVA